MRRASSRALLRDRRTTEGEPNAHAMTSTNQNGSSPSACTAPRRCLMWKSSSNAMCSLLLSICLGRGGLGVGRRALPTRVRTY
jgi:hypothetical protein